MRNSHLQYRCQWTSLRVERTDTAFTWACSPGQVLGVPISHGEGNYFADEDTLARLEDEGRIVLRYTTPEGEPAAEANPNGSAHNIAGISNPGGNVVGMMPHPERCCEEIMGGRDGRLIFESAVRWAAEKSGLKARRHI